VSLCLALNIAGIALEATGFLIVAVELFRTQRRETGNPKIVQTFIDRGRWVRGKWRRLLGKAKTVEVGTAIESNIAVGDSVRGIVRTGRGKTLEDHLAALEKNFTRLDKEVEEQRTELAKEIDELRTELLGTHREIEDAQKRREEEEREFRRTSHALQWTGIGLFVLGISFSGVANIISCS